MAGRIIICPTCNERIEEKLRIVKPKLLIVEGRDEEEFFGSMLARLGIDDIQVAGVGGKTKLRSNLKALKTDPRFSVLSSLGIARDADGDAKSAFQSVQDALKNADLPCPEKPIHATRAGLPGVTVMIVPPNNDEGALESLCINAVESDRAMSCVDQYFECLDATAGGRPKKDFIKAKARVFLSSQEDPTLSVGIAAQKGYWPFDAAVFDDVKEFLKRL
jgi:hypothetical protein